MCAGVNLRVMMRWGRHLQVIVTRSWYDVGVQVFFIFIFYVFG